MAKFKCTKCSATYSTRDERRVHEFGHLYPDAAKADRDSRLAQITELEEQQLSAMEEIVEE
jgi:hypothetical protein